jgi:hypothetical protein
MSGWDVISHESVWIREGGGWVRGGIGGGWGLVKCTVVNRSCRIRWVCILFVRMNKDLKKGDPRNVARRNTNVNSTTYQEACTALYTDWICLLWINKVVYYQSIKRDLKTRPKCECRCDERLITKVEESTLLTYTGLLVELEKARASTAAKIVY